MLRGRLTREKSTLLVDKLSEEQLYKLTCGICDDIVTHPVSCTICKKLFCLKCAILWKSNHDSCPYKCQEPWQIVEHPTTNLLLHCPYSEKCPKSTPETMTSHLAECKFAPEEMVNDLWLKREYMCAKKHRLEFWIATYEEMVSSKCCECADTFACRSVCHLCKVKYCVNCRPPLSTKTHCPNGHTFIERTASLSYVCDICGLKAGAFYDKVYDDIKCNFGVCSNCITMLPDEYDFKSSVNKYQECSSGHLLDFLPSQEMGVCDHCHNESRLVRTCLPCKTRYCIDCKHIRIQQNEKCLKKHPFQYTSGEQDIKCVQCNQSMSDLVDRDCGFGLCYQCHQILHQDANNLERIIGQVCSAQEKHDLMRCSSVEECDGCARTIFCPLQCYNCNKYYCLRCRPSHYSRQDYKGHEYFPSKEQAADCAICGEKSVAGTMECDVCEIFVCSSCYKGL